MLIGLTGGYCAGKNAAAAMLEARGWKTVDVDGLGHEAIELAHGAIVERFGASVVGPDGRLDRRAIARIVFADPRALADQEAIVHPIAIRLTDERIAAVQAEAAAAGRESLVCVNAALLHRAPQASACAAIVQLRAPLWARLRRARARDGAGAREALRRIGRQRGFGRALRAALPPGLPILPLRNDRGLEELERGLEVCLSAIEEIRKRRDGIAGA
jgi:dephospho-CoA kinase